MDDGKDFSIHPDDFVTVTIMKDIYEVQYLQKSNRQNNILNMFISFYIH